MCTKSANNNNYSTMAKWADESNKNYCIVLNQRSVQKKHEV